MKVVILRGISGSGKSTVAKRLASECEGEVVICSADDYFINNEKYKFDSSKLDEAHLACYRKFSSAVTDGKDLVIVDNTNIQLWEFSGYLQEAKANMLNGDSLNIIRCECGIIEAYDRNVHGVAYRTLGNMVRRMQNALSHWPEETIIDTTNKED